MKINEVVMPKAEDVAFYQDNGYWIAPKLIDDKRLELLRERMERVYNGEYETGRGPWPGGWQPEQGDVLRKTDNSHWTDHALRGLATDPSIGAIAAALMGASSIRLWHDQLLYKPGRPDRRSGGNVGWHQDYTYWQCAAEPTLITAWVAFDDVDLDNGCMQVVPRSHKWGMLNVNDFFEQDLQKQQEGMELPENERFEVVSLRMKAGQVSFHHAYTLHGSGPNTTAHPRRSLAVHLMTGETRYRAGTRGDNHMNVGLLGGKDGDLFEGPSFPELYRA
ncbi:phytanoyl-CoA dioxygenase family protein [Paenibacillus sp. 598K]|uniref:phytanoyl-CoA dioxygenase family protein n=1 Tax=Paenibacillus sp. 598K TaxID=1117987 RepID=UPI0016277008|nr:phytanoyl-CoA dioxygenase family protein [Paenibacillus sp. 598K]